MPELALVHVDDALVVLDKPAGLLAVPGRGADKQDCLSTRVQQRFADALVVHRLDMATSGLLVMARGLAAQRALGKAFEARQTHKRYEAVVHGALAPASAPDGWGTVDLPLVPDWPNRPLSKVDPVHGKPSLTRWRVLGAGPDCAGMTTTRVELQPVTGRSHQLRVHLLALGHPIVGDALYAPARLQAFASRLLLHATGLVLPHPVSGESIGFTSPAPF